jgi:histidinol-phosphatase
MMFPKFSLPAVMESGLDGRVAFALRLATEASNTTLKYFRTDRFNVEKKRDKSPVTEADKETESVVRKMILDHFPGDSVIGEEMGNVSGNTDYEWVVDPIDGTKSFISGVPLYSTLVGMTYRGEPTIGVIAIPALREIVIAAKGLGAWYGTVDLQNNPVPMTKAQVSKQSSLEDGLLVTSQADNFSHRNASSAYSKLEAMAYVTRTWGDGYGYLLVATGRAELMVDPIVNPWDVAAVAPVIEEAGGRFSSWDGRYDIRAGHCLGSNGLVHDAALNELRPFAN